MLDTDSTWRCRCGSTKAGSAIDFVICHADTKDHCDAEVALRTGPSTPEHAHIQSREREAFKVKQRNPEGEYPYTPGGIDCVAIALLRAGSYDNQKQFPPVEEDDYDLNHEW